MAGSTTASSESRWRQFFPIKSIGDVLKLFRHELTKDEPNLALLSVVVGFIEHSLAVGRTTTNTQQVDSAPQTGSSDSDYGVVEANTFPELDWSIAKVLYKRFESHVIGSIDQSLCCASPYSDRALVKKVADVIWFSLSRSYKGVQAHLQSLFSYITANKLDAFGVALAVVSGCQLLGMKDVALTLSEDHAWVSFGKDHRETCEVTWHGRGTEDKRGESTHEVVLSKCWLYLCGKSIVCSRHQEVAAIVSSINPSINATTDSLELSILQQELLWLLYDMGHLSRYPMALGNLADLEEFAPSPGRLTPVELYEKAIQLNWENFANHHVYPYTYYGGYLYRNRCYKEALLHWAKAAEVISRYNYSREDEEIYKEFLEINNELIPHLMKSVTMSENAELDLEGQGSPRSIGGGSATGGILQDPQAYGSLLQFYDGICLWEEGSSNPVLHVTWVNYFVFSLQKFHENARKNLHIILEDDDEESKYGEDEDGDLRATIESLSPRDGATSSKDGAIVALAAKCSESILNPDYLLGHDNKEPFKPRLDNEGSVALPSAESSVTKDYPTPSSSTPSAAKTRTFEPLTVDVTPPPGQASHRFSPHHSNLGQGGGSLLPARKSLRGAPGSLLRAVDEVDNRSPASSHFSGLASPRKHTIILKSEKMKGLKDLFLAPVGKLNTSAIKLQLTAQSQVVMSSKRKARGGEEGGRLAKRSRRE